MQHRTDKIITLDLAVESKKEMVGIPVTNKQNLGNI